MFAYAQVLKFATQVSSGCLAVHSVIHKSHLRSKICARSSKTKAQKEKKASEAPRAGISKWLGHFSSAAHWESSMRASVQELR